MNVKEIIKKYLMENGYNGLCCEDCGCFINDLIPCDDVCDHCVPGYEDITPEGLRLIITEGGRNGTDKYMSGSFQVSKEKSKKSLEEAFAEMAKLRKGR